jgi:hypothetical protein
MRLLQSLAYGTLLMMVLLFAMLAPLPVREVEQEDVLCDWFTCGLCEEWVD